MAINLDAPLPLDPGTEGQAMLNALQGNILSGHGRHATAHVLRFDPAQARAARAFLRRIGARLTSAGQQDLLA